MMPIGYWWTVAAISLGVACALTRWRRLRSFSAIPALLISELPFVAGYLLIASTVLALIDGDLNSPGGAAGAAVALLALAGLICRYGYYGDLAPRGDMPPMLVVHGQQDMLVSPEDARAFVDRVRAVSSRLVSYAELPGAHHDFDMFESIRAAAVSEAVEQFTERVIASLT